MKKRFNKSISKKIFLITFSLIFVVLIFSMLFQSLLFDDFYLNLKVKNIINETNKFSKIYSYQVDDNRILNEALFRFEQQTNSKAAIFSSDNKMKFLPNFENTGYDYKAFSYYCSELLNDSELIYSVLNNGNTESKIFINENTNSTRIGVLTPISLSSKNDAILVSVSSMQQIEEASSVIREFYLYLFFAFALLAGILTLIFTKLISKPLHNINKVAEKMSDLDFTAKCSVESEDEIGNLAITLNFLSSTLKDALLDLKVKNEKLTEDIEHERKIEGNRKDFIASISHDLKTPIGIIKGYAEGIKDGIATGEEVNIYLDTILDESNKMSKLVTNMLELSKLESDTIQLVLDKFNILRLIQKIIKSFKLEFTSKNLNLVLNTDLEYCYVLGDSFQLDQVFNNLISNALKYTPANNDVIISVKEIKNIIEISIENKGTFIPEVELDNIYNKFYTLDKSRNSSLKSNGLGLSIVKKILSLHESTFNIENSKEGVIFIFTLKKAEDQDFE